MTVSTAISLCGIGIVLTSLSIMYQSRRIDRIERILNEQSIRVMDTQHEIDRLGEERDEWRRIALTQAAEK